MRTLFTHKISSVVLFLSFLLIQQFIFGISYAQDGGVAPGEDLQTNPKTRNTVVTATVPDIIPPSIPILISPPDESLLNDATPTFIWQESTDNVGVDHYELYIDGSLFIGNIPLVDTTTSSYTLTYDSGSGQYSLTPTTTISNGAHTWHIIAYDAAGNFATSATWDFIIDTLAPSFVIEDIGPVDTAISAQDIDSVPEDPIELEDNEPLFTGTGESNASVQVTIQIPGESNQEINFSIDGSGNWSFQLGILPRDEVITLNFVITDEAGNISVLNDVKILIIQEYIIIPPPSPTPTPTPIPTPTPTPSGSPVAIVSPTPSPAPPSPVPTPTPIIKIPILPPKEIVEEIKKEVIKLIPEPVTEVASLVPTAVTTNIEDTAEIIAPVGVFVATSAVPIISLLALLLQLGQQLSWNLLLKILQALGLIPPKEPQGMVFDSQTNEPVSFALLTITSTDKGPEERILETVVTNVDGIYQGVQLPKGSYIISVSHQDYIFPTSKDRPNYLSIQDFYKGEEFEVSSSNRQQLFLIPVDKKDQSQQKTSIKKVFRRILQKIRLTDLFWPLFIISIVITLFYPTLLNLLVLCFYFFMLFKRFIHSLKQPTISGFIKDEVGSPIKNATIRISDPSKGELVAIVNTNESGYYESFLEPNKYQIQITKPGMIWIREGSQLSFEEVDVTQGPKIVDGVFKDINQIYKELFGELS